MRLFDTRFRSTVATALGAASLIALPVPASGADQDVGGHTAQPTHKGSGGAQSRPTSSDATRAGAKAERPARNVRLSSLVGMDIHNVRGESLGEVKDAVLDLGGQRVRYVILEMGGFLGIGDKLYAYPMTAFRTSADRDELVLDVPRDRLERAPGFARDNWPEWARYGPDVDAYWSDRRAGSQPRELSSGSRPPVLDRSGANPLRTAEQDPMLRRASDVLGMEISDRRDDDAAEVQEVIVNLADGRIRSFVLAFDRGWGLRDKLVVVPPSAINFAARSDNAFLRVSPNEIDRHLAFDPRRWPDLNDPRFAPEADRYLVTTATVVTPLQDESSARAGDRATDRAQPTHPSSGTGGEQRTDADGRAERSSRPRP